MKLSSLLVCVLILGFIGGTCAQCRANENWWVGLAANKLFFDFSSGAPVTSSVPLPSVGLETTSTYTANDGNIWFTTDGRYLYDLRVPATIANSLPSDPSSVNPGLIASVGQDTFFLFTNDADINVGRLGATYLYIFTSATIPATFVTQSTLISEYVCEGGAIIPGKNAYTYWYCTFVTDSSMTSVTGTVSLHCVEFDPTGVLRTVINPAFSWNCKLADVRGLIKFLQLTDEVLIGIGSQLHTFSFDRNTGLISNDQFLFQATNRIGYSGEFSPDGSLVYYCDGTWGYSGTLYQIRRSDLTITQISPTSGYAGMTLADDGKIYVSRPNANNYGVINDPNTFGVGCTFSNYILPSGLSGYNMHANVACGLAPTCPSPCDDFDICTVDVCDDNGVCSNVPIVGCGGAGGDPHIFTFDGTQVDLRFENGKNYVFYESPDLRVVLHTTGPAETSFITSIGVTIMNTHRLLAKIDNQEEVQFYLNGELLTDTGFTPLGNAEVFMPDHLQGALFELARYVTIGLKIDRVLEIVGGLHPSGGFFNIQILRSYPADFGLLRSVSGGHALRDLQEFETESLFN